MHQLLLLLQVTVSTVGISLPNLLTQVVQQECDSRGIVDVRVFHDAPLEHNDSIVHNRNDFPGAMVILRLFSNVSFGKQFRKSRVNVVHVQDLTGRKVHQIGDYIKHHANYDWAAKFLFYLPSVDDDQLLNVTTLVEALSFRRLYNNLFVINRRHVFSYNVLNGILHRHKDTGSAVRELFRDKFRQMDRYHLDDLIDSETYPFHFVVYGRMKIFNREAHFITMLVDRLNMSMVERLEVTNIVLSHQFTGRLKENGIVVTFGHVPGDYRRIFTHDTEGICALVPTGNVSTILDDFADPYDVYVWALWIVCTELTALVWLLVRWARHTAGDGTVFGWVRQLGALHMSLLQYCVLAPPPVSRDDSKVEKLLTFLYMLAVFNIVTIYISSVTSNLSTRRYTNSITTVRDLIDRQIPVGSTPANMQTLRLIRPSLNVGGTVHERSMYAEAITCSYARMAEKHSPSVYRMIKEPLVSNYIVYLLHRESILQELLERYVALTYQANLYRYWDNFIIEKIPIPRNYRELTAGVIKFEEMVWLFVIPPGGACLGVVVFALEVICHRFAVWRLQWKVERATPHGNNPATVLCTSGRSFRQQELT